MIYLDYNASVPLRPCAKETFLRLLEMEGNPSSPHRAGRELRLVIDETRKSILTNLDAKKLVFTSGGTEANALALTGLGSLPILVSAIEHESVLKNGTSVEIIPVTSDGVIDLEALEKKLSTFEKPGLLSLMLVNNETGIIQPVQDASRLARAKGWKVHTDACQAIGSVPLSFDELGVDMMTLSSHKCGGPLGVGALLFKKDLQLNPLIQGGGQEFGMRSGTLSAPLIAAFGAGLNEAIGSTNDFLREFQTKIEKALPEAIIYGQKSPRVSHVVCLGMPDVSAELQLMAFDLRNIAVSAGAACSSGKMKESHVLTAMGIASKDAKSAIRVSMGWKTQKNEVDAFIHVWKDIYSQQKLKEAS